MRRLPLIATFALVLAVPLWAQHGGGHSAGHAGGFGGHGAVLGGHAGFGSGHMGGGSVGGRHFGGGMHHGPGFSRGFTRVPRSGSSSRGFHGGRGPTITNFGFNHRRCWNCRRFGWGWGNPWWYSGYYDPYWWWDHGPSYDEDYERNRQIAAEMNAQNLEEMRMRQQDAGGDQDIYAGSSPAARAADPPQSSGDPIMPATVLVFRDQHKQEVENYAIVGQTLWAFAPQHTRKIPLADLDLEATARANDDRGVTFKVPISLGGQ